jgi:RNA polymerase sigma-70 factor (ECF subfamily)
LASLSKAPEPFVNDLLKGCQKNDRKSQKNLYQHFYGYAMSICLRYADDRDEAAELLNEAFMKIFKNIRNFDIGMPFKPWLRKILINTCINNYRRKKISFTVDIESAKDHSDTEEILSGISYQEILDIIRQLSPAYRAVFNLHVIEGYKHEEIAEMLNISVGASKSNLSKAKRNLQQLLKDYFKVDYDRIRQG